MAVKDEQMDFIERRVKPRRAEDEPTYTLHRGRRSSDFSVDNLKLSMREVIVVIVAFVSIASAFMTFNTDLEHTQAENHTKNEVMVTRVTSIESRLDKIEQKIDSIKDRLYLPKKGLPNIPY